ncbi:hypothetical protein PAXRUDRAFT_252169 [Paxillus rubicundulus Ve08.2h10]|uniref:Uncharacterized protein n=1 Tax=Paxillus rubicundulus Ve08.2h10 TaxID=930991 RepID=A0A0D0E649_9AGAM|nr:hypothetical protein PAXRUDRAFT_252169 [Paxillus rubicundulus Ve08.2h10]
MRFGGFQSALSGSGECGDGTRTPKCAMMEGGCAGGVYDIPGKLRMLMDLVDSDRLS